MGIHHPYRRNWVEHGNLLQIVCKYEMDRGRTVRLFLVLAIWNSVVCVFLYVSHRRASQQKPLTDVKYDGADGERGVHWRKLSVQERTNIFFLKTHKCGSSTIQNILMRFGYARHLDFVLPQNGNYLGFGTGLFESRCVAKQIMSPNQTFNIFAHHTRFHFKKVEDVMKPDAAFVTILREPSYVFESLYYYYDFARPMRMSLKQLIMSPKDWPRARQTGVRLIYGTNQISWDLGFNTVEFAGNSTEAVERFIEKIDREFDLVMITEYIEASLVLLCDLMNWPLENVVHLQLNKRSDDRVVNLNPGERRMVLNMNPIDEQVYQHFLGKFRDLVLDYGEEKMKSQVKKLLNLNSDLKRNCRFSTKYEAFRKTVSYVAQNTQVALCHYVSLNELEFTRMIRDDQFKRFSILRELEDLMAPDYEKS